MLNEDQLINGCCQGNRSAQRELYDRYAGGMLMVCMRYCKNQDDAEDILQEAFIKVFKNMKEFRKESTLGYWIKRIVINTAINYQRSKLYLFPMVELSDTNYASEKDISLSDHSAEDLLKMIQTLPVGCQVIFNMYAIEGYKHREIATRLGISEGTSKSQYARAKSILQQMVSDEDNINYEKYQ